MSKYINWLCTAFAGSDKKIRKLLETYGSAKAVYLAVENDPSMDAAIRNKLQSTPFGKDLPHGVQAVTMDDPDYPAALKEWDDSPCVLFYSGDLSLLKNSPVGVIGTRYADDYGLAVTKMYASHLAACGKIIAGGVALGVETTAYKAALSQGGRCIAVLPCGINRITPAANYTLMEKIISQGGLVLSAYAPDVPVLQGAYHQRGKLLAQCVDSLLITQCGINGGVHITVENARALGRRIYAVPGRIGSEQTSGTNFLIKNGAKVTTSVEDFGNITDQNEENKAPLSGDAKIIYDLIAQGYGDSATLIDMCGLPPQTAMQILSRLESDGYITYGSSGSFIPSA